MTSTVPVTEQPQNSEMISSVPSNAPPSVKYLADLDTVYIKQKMEAIEIITGFETKNKYMIMNKDFQQIFYAREESKECERLFWPGCRGFTLHLTDNQNLEIMRFIREFKYCMGCCWCGEGCCNMSINVESPPGKHLGRVTIGDSKCANYVKILDSSENHVYTIWISCCICQDVCCPDDVIFPITDPSLNHEVGRMAKVWRGCCTEALGDADTFRVEFPADMTLNNKILLIGALFFVDFLRFEQGGK